MQENARPMAGRFRLHCDILLINDIIRIVAGCYYYVMVEQ